MDWIDINNKGISHFSLHPHLMMRDDIHFDIFHLRCAIPRRMMNYLRKFMMKTTTDLMKKSTDSFLTKNWSNHNVLTCNLNKLFTFFIECELILFIKNILLVVQFLKDSFQIQDILRDLYNGLLVWKEISPDLVTTTVTNKECYKQQLELFEKKVLLDWEEIFCDKRSFLTRRR